MARLIDVADNPEVDPNETENLEVTEELEVEALEEATEENPETEEVPEKYQNKSVQELVHMHQEAEKALGRQGSEVGELRKIVDQYIQSQLVEKAPPPTEVKEEEIDWFSDPDAALEQKIANHPAIREAQAAAARSQHEANKAKLEQKHPDYKDIMQEQEFADWIKGSKVRTRLFIEADQGYDADAADELFTLWKERKNLAQATANADKAARKEELKQASTGNARGNTPPPTKKKYRRQDIINLMQRDPERYQQLSDEILKAYAEKRVV